MRAEYSHAWNVWRNESLKWFTDAYLPRCLTPERLSHDLVRYNGSENCSSTTGLLCSPPNLAFSLPLYFFFFFLVSLSPPVVIYGHAASPKVFHSVRWCVPRTPSALVKKRKDKRRPTIGDGKMGKAARGWVVGRNAIIEVHTNNMNTTRDDVGWRIFVKLFVFPLLVLLI